jgi:hypothetical protein
MKHKLLTLSFLFVTMSVLTSSRENTGINKGIQSLNEEPGCLQSCNEYAINITCRQNPMVQEKNDDTNILPVEDNEISLSPISRFILMQ